MKPLIRLSLDIRGAVQGVGFRPFVYRLASTLQLAGWVRNTSEGVFIEVEGTPDRLDHFRESLYAEQPPRAYIQSLEVKALDPAGYTDFRILPSLPGQKTALILPDIATCPQCLDEIRDARNRRYRYPFTNCTHCGPRYSIIEALPYDRINTTMRRFEMCPRCREEYENPLDRRFHAQPNACPECGPQLEFVDASGRRPAERDDALEAAVTAIQEGQIVALKGLGGFQLLVDARNNDAVERLRTRKRREEKPLALMAPSLEFVEPICHVSAPERRLLTSPAAPIVLLERNPSSTGSGVATSVAPGNPTLGVMLPYTPLHHLLMDELRFPVVATSGNVSDEPICTDNDESLRRLNGIADAFLLHDRPIARHVDDSVTRVLAEREMLLRRARGYAPLPVRIGRSLPPVLAVGGHLKNTVAVTVERNVFLSQHIGDLETAAARSAFEHVTADLQTMYAVSPTVVVCDLHPGYVSTQYARRIAPSARSVQHHYAHVLSCIAENEIEPKGLGISWDGTGYGLDGTIWGGEFLRIDGEDFSRFAHFRTFPLPGSEKAVREPRRSALGLLYELWGDGLWSRGQEFLRTRFIGSEVRVLRRMLERGFQCPRTSSVGRLFDAVASLLGLRQLCSFEGQAAMEVEFQMPSSDSDRSSGDPQPGSFYPFSYSPPTGKQPELRNSWLVDWGPAIEDLLRDITEGLPVTQIVSKFHRALCEAMVRMAEESGERRVMLSGGCFQNRHLTEEGVRRLRREGFQVYWHQRVPPNDGGLALGQALAGAFRKDR